MVKESLEYQSILSVYPLSNTIEGCGWVGGRVLQYRHVHVVVYQLSNYLIRRKKSISFLGSS